MLQSIVGSGLYSRIQTWQTRLIELLPDIPNNPLRCNVHVADITLRNGLGLVDKGVLVEYEALSYSWGQPGLTAAIICNGQQLSIPHALADAVGHLRKDNGPRWLWCDAICINQDDSSEKSEQVKIMLSMFAKARRVVAWLGSSKDNVTDGRRLIEAAARADYWTRTWVLQEIFAAQEIEFCWGHTILDPAVLYRYEPCKYMLDLRCSISLGALMTAEIKRNEPPLDSKIAATNDLVNFLVCTKYRKVSDNRDKLYAILGIVNNKFANALSDFPIDYKKTIEDVSTDLTGVLLYYHDWGLMWLLHSHQMHEYPRQPSWAFDLRDIYKVLDQLEGTKVPEFLRDPNHTQRRWNCRADLPGKLRTWGCYEGLLGAVIDVAGPLQTEPRMKQLVNPTVNGHILRKVHSTDGSTTLRHCYIYAPRSAEPGDMIYSIRRFPFRSIFILRRTRSETSADEEARFIGTCCWAFTRRIAWWWENRSLRPDRLTPSGQDMFKLDRRYSATSRKGDYTDNAASAGRFSVPVDLVHLV